MDKVFPGSYGVNLADREQALQDGIFSVDANVLCDLWRYSPETLDLLLNTMELLSGQGRLWITFQAVNELHRNRLKVVQDQHQRALEVMGLFWAFAAAVEKSVKKDRHHPTLPLKQLEEIAVAAKNQATKHWEDAQRAAAKPYDDPILKRVTTIIGNDFGKPPGEDKLAADREVALKRITARIPPGYMDSTKHDGGVGDALIWMDLMRLAERRQLPIIFITGDNKEDWWERGSDGKTRIGPRHELVTEMQLQAGVTYVQMDPEELQRYGEAALNIETPEEVFEELREVSQEPEPEPLRYVPNPPPDWMIPSHHLATTMRDDFVNLTSLGASVSGPLLKAMMAQQEAASQTAELVRQFRDKQASDLAVTAQAARRAVDQVTHFNSLVGAMRPDYGDRVLVDPAAYMPRPVDAMVTADAAMLAAEDAQRTIQSAEVMIDPATVEPKPRRREKKD